MHHFGGNSRLSAIVLSISPRHRHVSLNVGRLRDSPFSRCIRRGSGNTVIGNVIGRISTGNTVVALTSSVRTALGTSRVDHSHIRSTHGILGRNRRMRTGVVDISHGDHMVRLSVGSGSSTRRGRTVRDLHSGPTASSVTTNPAALNSLLHTRVRGRGWILVSREGETA